MAVKAHHDPCYHQIYAQFYHLHCMLPHQLICGKMLLSGASNIDNKLLSYLQSSYFEGAIGVNATSLVTLTTLYTSFADSLPPTGYLKLIDIW